MIDPATVRAALAGRIARFKQPKGVIVLPELPHDTMGKVHKNGRCDACATLFTAP